MSLSIEEMWEVILNDPELTEKLRRRIQFLREKLSAPSITTVAYNKAPSKDNCFNPDSRVEIIAPKTKKVKVSPKKVPESLENVIEYGKTIGLPTIECERFYDHFTANGWKVSGKAPMQDWKSSLRNWARTWRERGGKDPDFKPKPRIHRLIEIEDAPIDNSDAASVFSQKMSETLKKLTGGE